MKKALITGITGQDGSFLAELLLAKGYEVHGIVRMSSTFNRERIEHIYDTDNIYTNEQFNLHYGDLGDSTSINTIMGKIQPDEIYNLAAMSHVKVSFDMPEYTANIDGIGTLRLLEAMRTYCPKARFYQASTSELYGKVQESPQTEETPFYPRSPYGVAKLYSYWICKNYRESYGLHISNGILFNHESERRGLNFVTRKITSGVAKIANGKAQKITLGNIYAQRDWGYAKDYVEGMYLILQAEAPDDYVLATGRMYTVKLFVEKCFKFIGIDIKWVGEGLQEVGINPANNKTIVEISEKYFRPAEVEELLGDPTKAVSNLNWNPNKTSIDKLVEIMMTNDLKKFK